MSTEEVTRLLGGAGGAGVELAATGPGFEALRRSGAIRALLLRLRIFARVSPEQKVAVVELLMERGLIVGMCGDGGNDCGALRAAHAGVALSDADAAPRPRHPPLLVRC